jgi:hypothetical protein
MLEGAIRKKSMEDEDHRAFVAAWLAQAGEGLSPERLVQLFEAALGALWRRCHITLGEVTLGAVVDRVLQDATEKFPLIAQIEVKESGVDFARLHANASVLEGEELAGGIRFVLTHFLELLGSLTAEILTPALHAELSQVGLNQEKEPQVPSDDALGEDVKS